MRSCSKRCRIIFLCAAAAFALTSPAKGTIVTATYAGVFDTSLQLHFGQSFTGTLVYDTAAMATSVGSFPTGDFYGYPLLDLTLTVGGKTFTAASFIGGNVKTGPVYQNYVFLGGSNDFSVLLVFSADGANSDPSLPSIARLNQINEFSYRQLTFYDQGQKSESSTFELTSISGGALPEPATWAMTVGGFGLIGGAMRKRSKQEVSFG